MKRDISAIMRIPEDEGILAKIPDRGQLLYWGELAVMYIGIKLVFWFTDG